jgi:hypothetical protein
MILDCNSLSVSDSHILYISTAYLVILLLLSFMDLLFQNHPGSLLEGVSQVQVSTLAVKDNLLVAGGFEGELICKVG